MSHALATWAVGRFQASLTIIPFLLGLMPISDTGLVRSVGVQVVDAGDEAA